MTGGSAPSAWLWSMVPVLVLLLPLGGCATSVPNSWVVARSSLGVVTATDLERFIDNDPRWRPGATERTDPVWLRDRLEELLTLSALADEARRDHLLELEPTASEWRRLRWTILAEAVEGRFLALTPAVDEHDVEAFLDAHPEELKRDTRLRLRHLFRRVPATSGAEERALARDEMVALRAELEHGADFGQLARERSDSQSAGFDGLIAPVQVGDLDPAVEEVVWRLEPGELSPVVETAAGLHLFRLEERLPAADIPVEIVRARVRRLLDRERRQAAAERAFAELVESSGASYRPELLSAASADSTTAVFELGPERLTIDGVLARWTALPFLAQRSTSLEAVLRKESWLRLAAWQADRLGLGSESQVAARLARAENETLVRAAASRLADEVRGAVSDRELAAFVADHEASFRRPAASRLQLVLIELDPSISAAAVLDELDWLAAQLRSGELELAEAARRRSDDPSGRHGGCLGWVEDKLVAAWAGPAFASAVGGLAVGELSDPLLVEIYEPERMKYRADAYALVRVEERRPESTPPLEEIREAALDRLIAARSSEIRRRFRNRLLERIDARIDDVALAAFVSNGG